MRIAIRNLVLLAAALAGAARAQDASTPAVVRHVPPGDAAAGEPLLLVAEVTNGWRLAALDARWRPADGAWRSTAFRKAADGRFIARLEADEVRAPRLEYYVAGREEGQPETAWFASERRPHPLLVLPSEEEVARRDLLSRYRGLTSRSRALGEYASFGPHGGYRDRSSRFEVDYRYRILSRISYIQLGYVRLRGDVPPPPAFDPTLPGGAPQRATGMDYGYAEVGVDLADGLGASGQLILGADEAGFASGAGGTIRIGPENGARLEVGGHGIQRVGYDAFARFHWDTVPRFPMALGLHVTNTPAGPLVPGTGTGASLPRRTDAGAPVGIRALYDVGYEATAHLTIFLRAGYQARVATSGGPTLGAGATVEW
jgi:hypothetical protein